LFGVVSVVKGEVRGCGKFFDRFGIVELFILHDKFDTVPMDTATETVVALARGIDDKAGGFFIMERAGRFKTAPCPFELDVRADDIDNIKSGFQSLNGVLGYHGDIVA
jgi:hypothetical protein